MPSLGWGEWRPDVNELDGQHTLSINNVMPRADGYGPVRALSAFTQAIGAQCRGLFYARNDDGTVTIFAATSDRIYKLNNTSYAWDDVSAGGNAYITLPTNAQWQFAQFGDVVIAVQPNEDVQKFDLSDDATFSDLSGSPPDAAYVAVINQFLVLSGLAGNPRRIQWSAIGDITGWTAGTASSDFQDLPDGGNARPVVGGEFGIVLQDFAVRRMIFSPGSDVIFQIDRIGKDEGILAPYSVCTAGNLIFFLSPKGFVQMDANGGIIQIGREKVDRTFFAEWDDGDPQLMIGVADPRAHKVVFFYKSIDNSADTFDRALAYDWILQRWAPFSVIGEYAISLARPGLTLEGLDAVAPGALTISGLADNGSGLIRVTVSSTSELATGDFKTISGVLGAFANNANGTFEITVIDGTHFDLVDSSLDSQSITNAEDNGSGLIRLTVGSTAAWATGSKVVVAGVGGTTEANGNWVVTVVNGTTLDLQDSTFSNAYTSGGTVKDRYDSATDAGLVGGSADLMTFPWDDISVATLPQVSVVSSAHKVGFLSGDHLEATLETPEQSFDGQRMQVNGFWPITDAPSVRGSISKRENLNAALTYTNESTMNSYGFCALIRETRYSRAKIRIPAATDWTYASGVRPEARPIGKA